MKLKELRGKELGELKKLLAEARKDLPKMRLEASIHKDKNVKKLANRRREVAVLSGMVSAKEIQNDR